MLNFKTQRSCLTFLKIQWVIIPPTNNPQEYVV